MHDWIGLESLFIPIPLKAHTQQPILRSPVPEVIQTSHLPSHCLVQVGNDCADNGRSEMACVEGFGDIGRGEIDQHVFAVSDRLGRAECLGEGGRVGVSGEGAERDGPEDVVGKGFFAVSSALPLA